MTAFINDLPAELLVEIMRHLDRRTLKQAILTCQWWKSVIEHYFSWAISLNRDSMSHVAVESLLKTNRRIHKMTLTDHVSDSMVKPFGQIHRAEIDSPLGNGKLFFELFKCLPNLEDVSLYYIDKPEVLEGCDLPDLKKLKVLKLFECNSKILNRFPSSGVEFFSIRNISVESAEICHVVEFVRRQQNLTKLVVNDFPDIFFQQLCHTTSNGTIQSKLSELEFQGSLVHAIKWSGLLNFMRLHSKTLHKLKLYILFTKEIYELIFGELTNLKFLELLCFYWDGDYGMALKKSESIENLILHSFPTLPLSQLCKSMPNVKNLTLWCDWSAEKLQIISSALQKVTTLFVGKLNHQYDEIKFPNLTSLRIRLLFLEVDWDAFTVANSKITGIIIFRVDERVFNLKHIEIITRNLKLQTLKIPSKILDDEHYLSTIRKNCSHLKVLQGLPDFSLPCNYHLLNLNIPFS